MKVKNEEIGDKDILCMQFEYLTSELIEQWKVSNSDSSSSSCQVISADSHHWKDWVCDDWNLHIELYNVHNIGLWGTTPHS